MRVCSQSNVFELVALHSHVGTGLRDMRAFRKNFEALAKIYLSLQSEGFPLTAINLGGGLAVPTVKEYSLLELLRMAIFAAPPSAPVVRGNHFFKEYFDNLSECFRRVFQSVPAKPRVLLEPGRAVTSAAGALLCTVDHIRRRGRKLIAVTDAGALSTGLSVAAEYHEILHTAPFDRRVARTYKLTGNILTSLDILAMNKRLPTLLPGDRLLVMDAGAYMIPTATNFATLRAPILLLENGGVRVLRRRETPGDVMLRDFLED